MDLTGWLPLIAKTSYFVAAMLFILGIKRMASPVTARRGIVQAGVGMIVATLATFLLTGTDNLAWILAGLAIGIVPAWISGRRVAMTDMPQMVALYNGMGGGSAAAIGAVELLRYAQAGAAPDQVTLVLALAGALIGSVALSGSVIAWAKLDGKLESRFTFTGQQYVNLAFFVAAVGFGASLLFQLDVAIIVTFFALALVFGVLMTLPIGGADMPVVISLYNAMTGLAVAFEGYVLGNEALIIAGTMVGAAGMLLTRLMAKAMNRPIHGVL
ncbi:MAG TPA: NAD(P)(+) transhydrogenase (Re/Si-specific) subunit beta, partial [Xanthomonadaceae bacterium]|nr:NAD(P)(+) transhydrogenase (Re/Si-specific) subunit beta [Xanthomonadaceae bacterium]